MTGSSCKVWVRWSTWLWVLSLFSSYSLVHAASGGEIQWIRYASGSGTVWLDNHRQPALFTKDFADCQGDSLIKATRYDASLYKDNMTVMINFQGSTTEIDGDSLMMHFSVHAYGESRFSIDINPCTVEVLNMCPVRANSSIEVNGLIGFGTEDLVDVPDIAYSIPDFEGQAILRIYSRTTRQQVACYAAAMSNGNSFSHPAAVGSVLGLFTIIALVASVATAIYGDHVTEIRKHHAHSVSLFTVFSIFQHIFFTGALSVNWPSVLVAFWSNFAWSAGMIYAPQMQNSISQFMSGNFGDLRGIGSLPANTNMSDLGSHIDATAFQKRDDLSSWAGPMLLSRNSLPHQLQSRAMENRSTGFEWYGDPALPGLPLSGNYSGFAGTLSAVKISASNALLTGLVWLLIFVLIVSSTIIFFRLLLGFMSIRGRAQTPQLALFRVQWRRFLMQAILRLLCIAFFMMTTLSAFSFALGGAAQALSLAGLVFTAFFIGMSGIVAYALWSRLRWSELRGDSGRLQITSKKIGFGVRLEGSRSELKPPAQVVKSFALTRWHFVDTEERPHVHDDDEYTVKFGWLTSRFRRSRWWFFAFWFTYEFGRACFLGGAARHTMTQIFGLLIWEILAFILMVTMRPYEANQLNLLMVYLLGSSKIATTGLSTAFDARFGLGRILTTVIGVIIIIIHSVLTIALLVCIVLGAISSYMSIKRYETDTEFKPAGLKKIRARYYEHVDTKASDRAASRTPPASSILVGPERPKEAYFNVMSVRKETKIGDEDDSMYDAEPNPDKRESVDTVSLFTPYDSRAGSIRSTSSNLPLGARNLQSSTWSIRDSHNPSQEHLPEIRYSSSTPKTNTVSHHRHSSGSMPDASSLSLTSKPSSIRQKRRSTSNSILSNAARVRSPLVDSVELGEVMRPDMSKDSDH